MNSNTNRTVFNVVFHNDSFDLKHRLLASTRFGELKHEFEQTAQKLDLHIPEVHLDVETITRNNVTKFQAKIHFVPEGMHSFTKSLDNDEYLGLVSELFKHSIHYLKGLKDKLKERNLQK